MTRQHPTASSTPKAPTLTRDERLIAEAKRIHARFTEEFVEALNLCPWAKKARRDGHTRTLVVTAHNATEALEGAVEAASTLNEDLQTEVGFIVLPRLQMARPDFERWVDQLRERNSTAYAERSAPMAYAAFHPEAPADTRSAARMVPFMRRSPDLTIQAVRLSVLHAVRGPSEIGTAFVDPSTVDLTAAGLASLLKPKRKPLHEQVGEANLTTIQTMGVEEAEAILAAIRADRDQSYRDLL